MFKLRARQTESNFIKPNILIFNKILLKQSPIEAESISVIMVIDDQWSYLTMIGILEVVFRSASFPSCWFGLVEDKVIRLLKHSRLDSKKRSTRDGI